MKSFFRKKHVRQRGDGGVKGADESGEEGEVRWEEGEEEGLEEGAEGEEGAEAEVVFDGQLWYGNVSSTC